MQELGATRLVVHRTPRHIYAQVIAPNGSEVLASASTVEKAIVSKLNTLVTLMPLLLWVKQSLNVRWQRCYHRFLRPFWFPIPRPRSRSGCRCAVKLVFSSKVGSKMSKVETQAGDLQESSSQLTVYLKVVKGGRIFSFHSSDCGR